ncbi:YLP motif-containing protein 1 [Artemisia annua]|uniref:YLP motif-containing protein 1 n=1 Tax=Artemisia annua TaxID=35608 RepID=A0A2U1NI81_ARTAN|nr:YLP motif-containing protein 1 [Artemisia annua]
MRVDGNNLGPRGSPDMSRYPPLGNERVLKMIHDHGTSQNAANTMPSGAFLEIRDEMGLKRRRETAEFLSPNMYRNINNSTNNVHYDQPDRRFTSLHNELNYSYTQGAADTMQPNHHNLYNSHPPADVNWPKPKDNYVPNSFGTHFSQQPPLPVLPPPPLPIDPPRNHFFEAHVTPPPPPLPLVKQSMFPAGGSSSESLSLGSAVPQNHSPSPGHGYCSNNSAGYHASGRSSTEEFHTRQSSSEPHVRDIQPFPLRHLPPEKPNIIDGSHIFKHPHRASRPDHMVIILRGLPGSGKSYLAKVLRDIEVENGGEAPRIHSMDEYFMTEVEKAEDGELSKSSGSLRGKRQVMKKVMEYCYEPEMEEAYRASMLKAFKKTLDEGVYSFIIVDDRNLRVADFAQFWATAKRSGYEVYIVEASYKDPAGCAARNLHNFTLDDIQKMAGQWEEAPSLYMKMDIKSLLHGDGFDESGIQEVDMDMDDEDAIDASHGSDIKSPQESIKYQLDEFTSNDSSPSKDVKRSVTDTQTEGVNHLSKSKWSNDLDGKETIEAEGEKKKTSVLSGLIQAYSKEGKSVTWGDQGGNVGFSISATRKTNTRSLVIGPGSGYNFKSNPLSEEECVKPARSAVEPKSRSVFQEQIRAERESFKAVFDKRRQRIGVFNGDEE